MQFWRIYNNRVYNIYETNKLGFSKDDGNFIPDEYLENGEFVLMRTCFGIGDWGIISAMPRKLKEKYPNCKVYIPSEKMLTELFGKVIENNPWQSKFRVSEQIFKNNPYVDEFIDSIEGDIFHDHYRVYEGRDEEPLLEQLLRFWQFEDSEIDDLKPELYFSDEEIEFGNEIISKYTDGEFATLLLSNRYVWDKDDLVKSKINYNLPHFYWTSKPIEEIEFGDESWINMRNFSLRMQLYIKTKAKYNLGNQCGVNDCIPRHAPVITVQRQFPLYHNFVEGEQYI